MTSVKVAVRVRPFNGREKEMGAKLCIRMDFKTNTTYIMDPSTKKEQDFGFDYSYWSHDQFHNIHPENPMGYLEPDEGGIYSDQNMVFKDLGQEVLDNAFAGFNACLFAYGQTGSGKSYSIVGYGENKGIIPRACNELFKRIKTMTDDPAAKKATYKVQLSMIEIYNEKVHDLFCAPASRPKEGLAVREDKKIGVFVQGAAFVPVDSYEAIEHQIDIGTMNRTIGATNMNATSSRAHTVTQIKFSQKFFDETGKPSNEMVSSINLIDLAGSERASGTGATGDRLKEGANINKSLTMLGQVI